MSIISDPESWMGLRSARAVESDLAPPAVRTPPRPAADGFLARVLRLFRRR